MWPCGPGFSGMWIFPFIMIPVMLLVVYMIFGRGGFRGPCGRMDEHQPYRQNSETSLEILRRRYANGEIGKEEFEQIKNNILS